MPNPVLVTGAAGGQQGASGRHVASHLLERGIPVRAFVRTVDHRADALRKEGAEIFVGDLLNPVSVHEAMKDVRRAYFTYPVADGLMEAATMFAALARSHGLELVVNNSQFQDTPDDKFIRDLVGAPTRRNLQHRLTDRVFDWADIGAVHVQAPPYYENVRALVNRTVSEKDTIFLPWGNGDAVFPLAGGEDVAWVAATLLANNAPPSQRVYPLVNEALTVQQIVQTLSKVLGRPINYVSITDEQWANSVKERINPHAVDHLSRLWSYFRTREHQARPTDVIRKVTGRNPQRLEEFFRANIEFFAPVN
ncbi:NmrA family NAD(P)-binding protein [Occallatibacter riparius]|uniref:NmrA family NAD(P)-binding protein n=1 Tax=Occallatibacter riparius TaxID=1002689 RepID=A0A9J7BNS9_9BACT|nr:NmrA family NAD(P)-binding protein [Occallatibacter riparius]UWZ82813.1 NmrA family NAD(P)-binding protein [Occallatibacter riparius]